MWLQLPGARPSGALQGGEAAGVRAGRWPWGLPEEIFWWGVAQGTWPGGGTAGSPTSWTPLCELAKGVSLGRFRPPRVPQPRTLSSATCLALQGRPAVRPPKEVRQGDTHLSLCPAVRATGSTGVLLCPRPDRGSDPPCPEGLPGLLPDGGAPGRHDGHAAQVRCPCQAPPPRPSVHIPQRTSQRLGQHSLFFPQHTRERFWGGQDAESFGPTLGGWLDRAP